MASALLASALHPDELWSLIKFKFLGGQAAIFPPNDTSNAAPTLKRCYELLDLTSRSFAAVIQALDPELRPAIALFYLVLRGLDTVEDDMSIDTSEKVALLRVFHEKLTEEGWNWDGNGPKEKDRILLVQFDQVIAEFGKLKPQYQEHIADITKRMGNGMADFAEKVTVETKKDYNLYCHYVAGLVGIGLSNLFSASGLESPEVGNDERRSNSMGLFLQKTNIIRDYLEDLEDGRTWYPKEVWSKHADKLEDLRLPENKANALGCLNEMVTDALQHIPDVFSYLAAIKNQTVFNFCAIPQVMAISTLALCFDNHQIFKGVVKIRKGVAVSMMLEATNMDAIYSIFDYYTLQIKNKLRPEMGALPATYAGLNKCDALLAQARQAGIYTRDAPGAITNSPAIRLVLAAGLSAFVYATCVAEEGDALFLKH